MKFLIILSLVLISGCASKKKKVIQVNCVETSVEESQGRLHICDPYK